MDIKFLSFPTPHLQPDCCCRIYQYWIRIRIWTNRVRIEFASYRIRINPIHWQASAENWMTNHEVWWEGKIQFKLRVEKKTLKKNRQWEGATAQKVWESFFPFTWNYIQTHLWSCLGQEPCPTTHLTFCRTYWSTSAFFLLWAIVELGMTSIHY